MKISVVTVVLNDLNGILNTFRSIKSQRNCNYEWVVCDGGSTDGTLSFLEGLSNDVKWVSRKDRGIYDAMNIGVTMCTGDFIVFMNAGDLFYHHESIATVAEYLADEGGTDILFGGAILKFPVSGREIYRPPRTVKDSLWHGLPANHQATYYRKSMLSKTPYDLKYTLCGDYYLAATLISTGANSAYLDKPLAIFMVGGQSYKRLFQLFNEPYLIQRDVLRIPMHYRLASLLKRLVSTIGLMALSQPYLRAR